MKDNIHHLFPTPIWGFILNDQQYQSADYLDYILDQEVNAPSVKKSNFGGYQTHDRLNEVPVFKEFVKSLNHLANRVVAEYTNGANKPVEVKEMWGNINYKNSYNGPHTHSGILSGVFYLYVPPNSGDLVMVNPAVRADGKMFRASNYGIKPKALACIMFPSWLEHYVEASQTDEKRVSISFNIDEV